MLFSDASICNRASCERLKGAGSTFACLSLSMLDMGRKFFRTKNWTKNEIILCKFLEMLDKKRIFAAELNQKII